MRRTDRPIRRSFRAGALRALIALVLAAPTAAADEVLVVAPGDDFGAAVAAVPDGGTIEMLAGSYATPSMGFPLFDLDKSFTVQGAGGTVAFDGADQNALVWVRNLAGASGHTVTFRRLTFRRGRSTAFQLSGGVTVDGAAAVFEDCVFDQNVVRSGSTGGGALLLANGADVVVRESLFLDSSADGEGGAIVSYDSRLRVERSQLIGNRVNAFGHRASSAGGAIAALNRAVGGVPGRVEIVGTRFEGNEAGFAGGAVYGFGAFDTGTELAIVVDNSTFEGNRVQRGPGADPAPSSLQGGAIHVEDQTRLELTRSRFFSNEAEAGGAVNGYRAALDVSESTFRGNRATGVGEGTGFGGAIGLLSGDQPQDGDVNRPSGSLEVQNSFIQCAYGDTDRAGQRGGAIFASGDRNRSYGLFGVTPMGSVEENEARVVLEAVAIVDCRVSGDAMPGEGGGFELAHVDADILGTIVLGSSAAGELASGGGGRIVVESRARLTDVTFAGNAADHLGGGLVALGSEVETVGSSFTGNAVGLGHQEASGQSRGAAVWMGPIRDFFGHAFDAKGRVEDSRFVDNQGLAVFDDDEASGLVNDVRYDANRFSEATSTVYQDPVAGGPRSVAELDTLVIDREDGTPDTMKSSQANVEAPTEVAALLVVPTQVLGEVAAGDPEPVGEAFAVYAHGGASAALNGESLSGGGSGGFVVASEASYVLTVGDLELHAGAVQPLPALLSEDFESGGFGGWSLVVGD